MGVAGYFRVSEARDEMRSPELYQGEIERYCSYKNLALDHVFSDIDYSGYRNSEQRPALREMVRRRHEFSAIVIPKLSRFGRSVKHLAQLFDTFDSDGIPLIFLDLGMDTSTSQGRLLRHIMAAFAEYESDVKADYTRANHRLAAQEGRIPPGQPPFGYRKIDKTFEIHEAEASIIRTIFRRYNEGASQYRIVRELNEAGHLKNGKPWRATNIGRTLDSATYAAFRLLDDELIPGTWEPIVDRDLWKRLVDKRRLAPLQIPRQRGHKKPKQLLSGLIVCGNCGRRAYHLRRRRYADAYGCRIARTQPKCRGGEITVPHADSIVTNAFLDRTAFEDANSNLATAKWEEAGLEKKRMMLHAAIERVVILPRVDGDGRTRNLFIEWRDEPGSVTPTVKTPYPNGVAERLRQREATRSEREKQERSERARRYSREWNEHRRVFKESRGPDLSREPGPVSAFSLVRSRMSDPRTSRGSG